MFILGYTLSHLQFTTHSFVACLWHSLRYTKDIHSIHSAHPKHTYNSSQHLHSIPEVCLGYTHGIPDTHLTPPWPYVSLGEYTPEHTHTHTHPPVANLSPGQLEGAVANISPWLSPRLNEEV